MKAKKCIKCKKYRGKVETPEGMLCYLCNNGKSTKRI